MTHFVSLSVWHFDVCVVATFGIGGNDHLCFYFFLESLVWLWNVSSVMLTFFFNIQCMVMSNLSVPWIFFRFRAMPFEVVFSVVSPSASLSSCAGVVSHSAHSNTTTLSAPGFWVSVWSYTHPFLYYFKAPSISLQEVVTGEGVFRFLVV